MKIADDFLAILPPDSEVDDTQSQGGISQATGKSTMSNKSFIQQNKEKAGDFRHWKKSMACERLAPEKRARLDEIMADIDENLDNIVKEKEEYYAQLNGNDKTSQGGMSKVSRLTSQPNIYSVMDDKKNAMDKIDEKLRQHNPVAFSQLTSVMDDSKSINSFKLPPSSAKKSKMNDDLESQFSMPVSGISRKSNFTTITLMSGSQLGSTKNQKLPKEQILRDKAIQRKTQAQLKEIENHLRRIRKTDDLSYSSPTKNAAQIDEQIEAAAAQSERKMIDEETLMRLIDECKEEEDKLSIMHEGETDHQSAEVTKYLEKSVMQKHAFDAFERRMDEASEEIVLLKQKDMKFQQEIKAIEAQQKAKEPEMRQFLEDHKADFDKIN